MPSGVYPRTLEHNAKNSAAQKKRYEDPEERKKQSASHKGKNTGDRNPMKRPEVKAKQLEAVQSFDNREKHRIYAINRWADPKQREKLIEVMNYPKVKQKLRKAAVEQFQDPRKREKHRRAMNCPRVKVKLSVSKQGDKNPAKRPEVRKKMGGPRPCILGENNPNWKGGPTLYDYPLEFINSRKEVKVRDNYQCQLCGKSEVDEKKSLGRGLAVHHIDYDRQNCELENLITLCCSCNGKVNSSRPYWKNYFEKILLTG